MIHFISLNFIQLRVLLFSDVLTFNICFWTIREGRLIVRGWLQGFGASSLVIFELMGSIESLLAPLALVRPKRKLILNMLLGLSVSPLVIYLVSLGSEGPATK